MSQPPTKRQWALLLVTLGVIIFTSIAAKKYLANKQFSSQDQFSRDIQERSREQAQSAIDLAKKLKGEKP